MNLAQVASLARGVVSALIVPRRNRSAQYLLGLVALCVSAHFAHGGTIKELTRIEGQGESVLRGVGLVVGLQGTGDSSKDIAVARPLVALMKNNGQGIGLPEEVTKSKTEIRAIALVSVTATIRREGARVDDTVDVIVSTINSATSLRGGRLYLTSLQGPSPQSPVYAIAEGGIELDDTNVPTVGRVRGGARMIKDILMPEIGDSFKLVLEPPFAGWGSASAVAEAIQDSVVVAGRANPDAPVVAKVIDERKIEITIPREERANKGLFLAQVLGTEVKTEFLDLPAQVIVNSRTGAIIVTGNVTISPVAITHKDLQITTTAGTSGNGAARGKWTDVATAAKAGEAAKLTDLLAALDKLSVPAEDQISILQMLHKTGKLEARLVMD
ncbi:MAG: flagellar basal body P-ring protein FlgI [Phycisphaerales bacterium]